MIWVDKLKSVVITLNTDVVVFFFFFQAEDGIRDLVRSRGLGDVYKRQWPHHANPAHPARREKNRICRAARRRPENPPVRTTCLLYTSDAADERSSVDLGGRRIIKKKTNAQYYNQRLTN